jgi:D-alanyl-D-alanine carboxypeptidase/D-alanyl-D-alanine-endopeptidase (penicillin-binding protein 4)
MSRNLLLTLAAEKISAPGDVIKGKQYIKTWLEEKNFSTDGFYIENGSGLSRTASISTEQIINLLKYAYASDFMPEFLSSLSISGLDGTMSDRNKNDDLTGKLHIKTGSIDHVSSVAGYMHSKSGKRYGLAIIHNEKDIHKGYGEELQNSIMQWLYNYED